MMIATIHFNYQRNMQSKMIIRKKKKRKEEETLKMILIPKY